MSDGVAEQVDAWRSVAAGWEKRRALFWDATRALSERLVDLLAPQPGETIVELAAGPGDTGFLAAGRLGSGGRLISSDIAPEMVEAARRRAVELGVTNAEFRVLDAAAVDLPDGSVDGVLCRFGLMLVMDMEQAVAELARVLRPGGRASIAVWAETERNDWITAGGRAATQLGLLERPDPDAPGPFRLADSARLRALVTAAGLQCVTLEDARVTWRARSLDEWWETSRDTSPTLSALSGQVGVAQLEALRQAAEELLARHVGADGSLVVPGLARALLAVRPS